MNIILTIGWFIFCLLEATWPMGDKPTTKYMKIAWAVVFVLGASYINI